MSSAGTPQRPSRCSMFLRRLVFYVFVLVGLPAVSLLIFAILDLTHEESLFTHLSLDGLVALTSLYGWIIMLSYVVAEFPIMWGQSRLEHDITLAICLEVGLALYSGLAHVFGHGILPTLDFFIAFVSGWFQGADILFLVPPLLWSVIQGRRLYPRMSRDPSIVDRPPVGHVPR
jgi:hypothetical protein